MQLHFTSGYHPEGDDGQTKWTNQTLEQYLQVYSNYQQDNWSKFSNRFLCFRESSVLLNHLTI